MPLPKTRKSKDRTRESAPVAFVFSLFEAKTLATRPRQRRARAFECPKVVCLCCWSGVRQPGLNEGLVRDCKCWRLAEDNIDELAREHIFNEGLEKTEAS